MRLITAIIRKNRLNFVRTVLLKIPHFPGMSISNVLGCTSPDRHGNYSDIESLKDFSEKIRLETVCSEELVPIIVETIKKSASINKIGDGVIWTTKVESFDFLYQTKNDTKN